MTVQINLTNLCKIYMSYGHKKFREIMESSDEWGKRNNTDYFPYIQIDERRLSDIIKDIQQYISFDQMSFLDIGCGYPVIPAIMDTLKAKKAVGIEYNEKYISKFSYYNMPCDVEVYHADLLTFPSYKEYDVLYSYVPISNRDIMLEGLRFIQANMKPGAIFYFIDAGIVGSPALKDLGFHHNEKNNTFLYKKPKLKKV